MQSFSKRSTISELMDNFHVDANELNINLKELEIINQWLGGHAVSLSGLKAMKPGLKEGCCLLDIGCGGGDSLLAFQKFGQKNGIQLDLSGLDINPNAIAYAKNRCNGLGQFEWLQQGFEEIDGHSFDVIHCSLFMHHLYGAELKALTHLLFSARKGFIVNDLQRHFLAYHSISLLTRLFSNSYLVKNDARLSVAKGFSRKELEELFPARPGWEIKIEWKWAFRWLITGKRI